MLVPFKKPCSFMAQFSSKWLYNYICERNPVGYYSNYRPQSFLAAFREIICVMKWRFPAAANKPISNLFCKWQATLNGVIQLGSIHWLCICLDFFGDSLFQSRKWLRAACYLQNPQMCSVGEMINNARKKLKLRSQLFHPSVKQHHSQGLVHTEAEDKGLLALGTCSFS